MTHADDEMGWAMVDEGGTIINVIVCQDEGTARSLGYTHLIHHPGTGIRHQAGIGWTTPDGGQTWEDTRRTEMPRVHELHRRDGP